MQTQGSFPHYRRHREQNEQERLRRQQVMDNGEKTGIYLDDDGFDLDGYDSEGFNRWGYDRCGYDRDGNYCAPSAAQAHYEDKQRSMASHRLMRALENGERTGIYLDDDGYDIEGFDEDGYDRQGYDRNGFNRHGHKRIFKY